VQLWFQSLVLGLGVALLVAGAAALVEGAVALARRARVSEIVIGMTLVSLGTTAPELAVNLSAAFTSVGELVLGNVVGSNIFNTLAVIGCAALVRPLVISPRTTRFELPFGVFAAVGMIVLIHTGLPPVSRPGSLSRLDGSILLGIGLVFCLYVAHTMRATRAEQSHDAVKVASLSRWVQGPRVSVLLLVLGPVLLAIGGRMIVESAVAIAEQLEMSTRVIALSIVAIGTSLPELATSLAAAGRGNTDMAVGNVIGANVMNIVLVLGVAVMAVPIANTGPVLFELGVNLGASLAVLAFVYLGRGRRIVRSEGAVLVAGYLAYLWVILRG